MLNAAIRPAPTVRAQTIWETLHTGPIVKLKIPSGAVAGVYHDLMKGVRVPNLQFCNNVRGGLVNIFVHTQDESLRGRTVVAAVSILKQIFGDGREYLYVRAEPVTSDVAVTHRLTIMSNDSGIWDKEQFLVFRTPQPLCGLILLSSAEVEKPPFVPKTDDSQLERLLYDGWKIERETAEKVELFKMKGNKRRTMTHHRPKRKRT